MRKISEQSSLSGDELSKMATRLLLATLGIPLPPARGEMDRLLDMQDNTLEKQRKLANLLGLNTPPTRNTLLKGICVCYFQVVLFV